MKFLQNWVLKWIRLSPWQPHKKIKVAEVLGFAHIIKDDILGKKIWVSYRGEASNEVSFIEGEPLVFPPKTLPVGTRVYLLKPEEKE